MDKARYLVEAHVVEGVSVAELSATHGVSKSWLYKLLARYREGGIEAIEPRSRRPHSCSHQTAPEIEQRVLELREELASAGFESGAQTIHYLLERELSEVPSVSTIWRILRRAGLVTPQPRKRPVSSMIRFAAELPNQMWQADFTHWSLKDGTDVEILNFIDDHSRLCLCADAYASVTAPDVVTTFEKAADYHGFPASLLTDNGAVFTGRYRGGRVKLEARCDELGVIFKNSRPYHPQTCGKVERFHQTMKRYLASQGPAETLEALQAQIDAFVHHYNNIRPHRAHQGATPLSVYSAKVKAHPKDPTSGPHYRVREDKVDRFGKVTLRHRSRLLHLYVGRRHTGKQVRLLVAGLDVRVIDIQGEVLGLVTIDPANDYQPMRAP